MLCEEEDATREPTFPKVESASTLRWIGMYAEIMVILYMLTRLKMQKASLVKEILCPPDYIPKH